MATSIQYNKGSDTWDLKGIDEVMAVTLRELLLKEQGRVVNDIRKLPTNEDLAFLGHQLGRVSYLLMLLDPSNLYAYIEG